MCIISVLIAHAFSRIRAHVVLRILHFSASITYLVVWNFSKIFEVPNLFFADL